jgi:hypothetical protein
MSLRGLCPLSTICKARRTHLNKRTRISNDSTHLTSRVALPRRRPPWQLRSTSIRACRCGTRCWVCSRWASTISLSSSSVACTLLTNANPVPFDPRVQCAAIEAVGIRPRNFASWSILTELHCVANVVKHAEGDAAAKLRKVRPDLLQHPAIKGQRPEHWLLEQAVQRPLAGDDLYLECRDFEKYVDAALAFWADMSTAFGVRRA